jgi:hypothetical protein
MRTHCNIHGSNRIQNFVARARLMNKNFSFYSHIAWKQKLMKITEVIEAYGHQNVRSTHKTTFEITKEADLTKRGDCIIAVNATKGAADFNPEFKEAARKENAKITVIIEIDGEREIVRANGNPRLSFTHPTDLVIRKSGYICGRTVAVGADKAASDFSRKLVEKMRSSSQKIEVTLTVES